MSTVLRRSPIKALQLSLAKSQQSLGSGYIIRGKLEWDLMWQAF